MLHFTCLLLMIFSIPFSLRMLFIFKSFPLCFHFDKLSLIKTQPMLKTLPYWYSPKPTRCHGWLWAQHQCFPSSPLPPLWESSFGRGLYIFGICRAAGSSRSLEKLRQRFSWGSPGRKPTSTHPQASFGMSLQPGSWQGDWGFSQPLSFRSGNWSAVHTTIKQEVKLQIIDLPLRFTVQD